MNNRIIELAIEALEKRKAAVEMEIAGLRSLLRKRPGRAAATAKAASWRSRSNWMKAYWARIRAKKLTVPQAAKASGVVRKPGPQSAAARRAVSKRMKVYWAKLKSGRAKA